jgi:transposase
VIGEVADREFLGVTNDNTAICLETTLREELLNKGKTVTVVNMDMSKLIRGVTKRVFPYADIVADKFHVIKYTNRVIDLCRIAIQKTVNERWQIKRLLLMKTQTFHKLKYNPKWEYKIECFQKILKNHPEIKLLWDLKNKLHGFYRCKSSKTAKESWKSILDFLEQHKTIHPEFADLKKTFLNWEIEILNYFIHRTTNAYIEGINNRIETLKRKKFGFRSKEKFIKVLLYMLFPISDIFINLLYNHYL